MSDQSPPPAPGRSAAAAASAGALTAMLAVVLGLMLAVDQVIATIRYGHALSQAAEFEDNLRDELGGDLTDAFGLDNAYGAMRFATGVNLGITAVAAAALLAGVGLLWGHRWLGQLVLSLGALVVAGSQVAILLSLHTRWLDGVVQIVGGNGVSGVAVTQDGLATTAVDTLTVIVAVTLVVALLACVAALLPSTSRWCRR